MSVSALKSLSTGKFCCESNAPFSCAYRPETKYWNASEPPWTDPETICASPVVNMSGIVFSWNGS